MSINRAKAFDHDIDRSILSIFFIQEITPQIYQKDQLFYEWSLIERP